MFCYLGKGLNFSEEEALVQVWDAMPKQNNYSHCEVYVSKYMDYTLQGFNISTLT